MKVWTITGYGALIMDRNNKYSFVDKIDQCAESIHRWIKYDLMSVTKIGWTEKCKKDKVNAWIEVCLVRKGCRKQRMIEVQ